MIPLLLTVTVLFSHNPLSVVGSPDPTPVPDPSDGTDFIRSNCNATLYPEVCYTSLSRYAKTVQQNPASLARVAIGVSFSKTRHLAAYVANVSRQTDYGPDPRAASAIHDCFSNFGDAVDELRGSMKQMRQLVAVGSDSFRFQMSNVQTWLSAAFTDLDTCTDGFEEVSDCKVKKDVCDRVEDAKKFASNALALVNSYAQKGMR